MAGEQFGEVWAVAQTAGPVDVRVFIPGTVARSHKLGATPTMLFNGVDPTKAIVQNLDALLSIELGVGRGLEYGHGIRVPPNAALSNGSVVPGPVGVLNVLERFTRAALPAVGSPGRIVELTDYDRGLWIDDAVQWHSLTNEWINVKAFGCKGDDATDDTANAQAAMNAVTSTGIGPANGTIVYWPPGTYKISAVLDVKAFTHLLGPRDQTTLSGAVIHQSVAGVDGFQIMHGGGFTFENLTIWGTAGGAVARGIRIGDSATPHLGSGGLVLNCRFFVWQTAAIEFENASDIDITNCGFEACVQGLYANGAGGTRLAEGVRVTGCIFFHNSLSIKLGYAQHWSIIGNQFSQEDGPAFAGAEPHVRLITTASYNVIDGNTFEGCGTDYSVAIEAPFNVVSNNVFVNNRRGCIRTNSSFVILAGNSCTDGSQQTNNTYDAIEIGNLSDRVTAMGNVIFGTGAVRFRYGFNINAGASNSNLHGNTTISMGTGNILDGSASTHIYTHDGGETSQPSHRGGAALVTAGIMGTDANASYHIAPKGTGGVVVDVGGISLDGKTNPALHHDRYNIANAAVGPLWTRAGKTTFIGTVTITNVNAARTAMFEIEGGNNAVAVIAAAAGFTAVKGTAGSVNVYWDAGNARYEIQNNSGGLVTFDLTIVDHT